MLNNSSLQIEDVLSQNDSELANISTKDIGSISRSGLAESTPHSSRVLVQDAECLMALIRTISEIDDAARRGYLTQAAGIIGTVLLDKLKDNVEAGR